MVSLATNPRLLVLDEATEGLAPLVRREIWHCIERLKAEGQSILLIDKNVAALTRIADAHYIVEKGRIVWSGTSAELAALMHEINRVIPKPGPRTRPVVVDAAVTPHRHGEARSPKRGREGSLPPSRFTAHGGAGNRTPVRVGVRNRFYVRRRCLFGLVGAALRQALPTTSPDPLSRGPLERRSAPARLCDT